MSAPFPSSRKPFPKVLAGILLLTMLTGGLYVSAYYMYMNANHVQPVIEKQTVPAELPVLDLPQAFVAEPNLNFDLSFTLFGTIANKFTGFSPNYSEDEFSVFCFRGNPQRNNPSRGVIRGVPTGIEPIWQFKTAYDTTQTAYGLWGGGAGWTGQPMLVRWTYEEKIKLCITQETFLENPEALELIIGSLCGNIYFLDAETGKPTRPHLSIGNPIKGSISVDPRKNGLLYVGQGVQHTERFGAYVFDMFAGNELLFINGKDPHSHRQWGAFDSNPLIDTKTGTVFWPAENGLLYAFSISNQREISELVKMRYRHSALFRPGIESSMAVIDHYGFFADNSGSVLCVDLRTLEPIWNVSNEDDSDATIAVDQEENGSYYLYTGNEVDKFAPIHTSYFRKLDARNGDEIWRIGRTCRGTPFLGKTNSGGILASPVIGKHQLKAYVYCIFSRVDDRNRSEFVAINKETGKEHFSVLMDQFSWSSPVDIYDEKGKGYVFFTDVRGTMYVVDGLTGELLLKEKTPYTFESSPVIIHDRIYIASRGRSILCFQLKGNSAL
jgi:outer membrane protein assembly factor BamB